MLLIGLTGRARSGKDTAARFLMDTYSLEPMSFAAPIKKAMADLFGLDERHLDGELKEAPLPGIGKSPRYLFQTFGTEWGRQLVHPDVWLHAADVQLENLRKHTNPPGVVFSDVRFENEAQWIRERGGHVLHIVRPGAPAVEAHASEDGIELQEQDRQISNTGTLGELYGQLLEVMHAIRGCP